MLNQGSSGTATASTATVMSDSPHGARRSANDNEDISTIELVDSGADVHASSRIISQQQNSRRRQIGKDAEPRNRSADGDRLEVTESTKRDDSKGTIKLSHIYPIHAVSRGSILSRESTTPTPSFVGFRNLAMIVLAVSNLRLVIENYSKYGVLIRFSRLGISHKDILYCIFLTATIPLHLFIAIVIERLVAIPTVHYVASLRKSEDKGGTHPKLGKTAGSISILRPKPKYMWGLIVLLHSVNAMACLWVTTVVVYNSIYHPLLGTACEIHAVIVCLKVASFALTNRDLRESMLNSQPAPAIYNSAPYPKNLTLKNLSYFWWAPTLVYQPVYPRSPSFRPLFFVKRILEMVGLSFLIWFLSAQYAVPTLENSLVHFHSLQFMGIMERLMKLASISMAIWLAGFFCIFQSGLNALAEVMRFGDRSFYDDWWNSKSVGEYWRLWNKPVTNYFRRHIYVPLVRRGWKSATASVMVFFVSAVLHELLVGVPTHNVIGVAFSSMILQIPLIQVTAPLEKMNGPTSGIIGNCIFWFSFFIGQPLGVLLYYFAWNVSIGKVKMSDASSPGTTA
ncbi:MBOAT, membrane-bound O-acyltransferase family-domain-containing protein [Lipomyces tetrasporus]|uniref:O-acyltransferase n=1 Tax=Lipomyces tetrasporus TaxID=54092 RepID=A0AAD7QKP5_9ASCO|nr:MBOAT, membrane-bound O-acyltransferase family-domain-containing protein [Lipomyces tetrasporus]KAJ8097047.1 MBOAT, membrane-bound O-acyltransferase family-domain-containing protein [Lipomyces tetrasporus]